MKREMTAMTGRFYQEAVSDILTIEAAVRFLEQEAKERTFREKLDKFAKGQDLRERLVQGLLRNDPGRNEDAVRRRVRGWLSVQNRHSVKKMDAIEVCFILGLSLQEADEFVTLVSDEALHWRSPDEIVFIFALQHGMTYREAVKLNGRMQQYLAETKEAKEPQEDSFTPIVREEAAALKDEEELADFLKRMAGRLGRLHNYAYQEFMDRIELLTNPETESAPGMEEEYLDSSFKMCDIFREYLFGDQIQNVRSMKKSASGDSPVLTRLQEIVSKSWPDETTLSKMKNRKKDVTRKTLILLFLATDTGLDWDDEEPTKEEMFEDLYSRLNLMLENCGFAGLDPRAPFDWLIL